MDIEQAMRAMAPLTEEEERLALGLEDAPWPPPLTAADRVEARGVRFAAWISDAEWRALRGEGAREARCADGAPACATTNRRIS